MALWLLGLMVVLLAVHAVWVCLRMIVWAELSKRMFDSIYHYNLDLIARDGRGFAISYDEVPNLMVAFKLWTSVSSYFKSAYGRVGLQWT